MRSLFPRYRLEMLHARIYLMLFKAAVTNLILHLPQFFLSAAIR
jgi:hypothetical protein